MPSDLFETSIEAITFEDVRDLANSDAEESIRLELKREFSANSGQRDPWMTGSDRIGNPARDAIAKEVVAFANAFGGTIVIGVDETADFPKRANGLAADLVPRVSECADRLRQALISIIDPPIRMLEVRGIPVADSDAGVIVIRVSGSPIAPYGVGRPPAAYVRRGPNSEPLTMRDLQSIFFEVRSRQERIRERRAELSVAFLQQAERVWPTFNLEPEQAGVAFRCSFVSADDLAIPNIADKFWGARLPVPHLNILPIIKLSEYGENWKRVYRAVEYIQSGQLRYSRQQSVPTGLLT